MDTGLDGRTALVVGASGGLGLATAKALAAEGVRTAIVGRSRERLDAVLGDVPNAIALVADITDVEARRHMMDEAENQLGQVDILIANGGGPPPGTFASTDFDAYQGALDLNLLPAVDLCKRFIPSMQERGWGRVVAITSQSVREPIDVLILSNTARAALTSFLKTTAREVAADGVTVNTVQPGAHLTDRLTSIYADLEPVRQGVPAKRLGDPEDFGRIVTFLCSESAKYVVGASLIVDGGNSHGLQ
ncbi:MAG: SDR family oxidoreductase [Acidimicrobiales bacterium]|nr:MAG: SDR family oxidoreductase [Acidimicrobiales bacterium]